MIEYSDPQFIGVRWLVIYNNVESLETLRKYWVWPRSPGYSKSGHALITSRKQAFAFQPAKGGLEVESFRVDVGAQFLGQALHRGQLPAAERLAAQKLSEKLGGHPLGLAQIAALSFQKRWRLEDILLKYERFPRKVHETMDINLFHAGYSLKLSTVFEVSFTSLSPAACLLLGIICFLQPDGISEELFKPIHDQDTPDWMSFIQDQDEFEGYLCLKPHLFYCGAHQLTNVPG